MRIFTEVWLQLKELSKSKHIPFVHVHGNLREQTDRCRSWHPYLCELCVFEYAFYRAQLAAGSGCGIRKRNSLLNREQRKGRFSLFPSCLHQTIFTRTYRPLGAPLAGSASVRLFTSACHLHILKTKTTYF